MNHLSAQLVSVPASVEMKLVTTVIFPRGHASRDTFDRRPIANGPAKEIDQFPLSTISDAIVALSDLFECFCRAGQSRKNSLV